MNNWQTQDKGSGVEVHVQCTIK